ncbi:MAG: SRPBCC family protein [Nocardiaceae bacterium]|nr:SRPBCC family protein [Nocardiaceae bacterium]
MPATLSADITVNAPPAKVLAAIAALTDYPLWSDTHKKFTVVSTDEQGRPTKAEATVTIGGKPDDQVISYEWSDNSVRTTLVSSSTGAMKSQQTSYTVTPSGAGSKMAYEITADPAISAPGFIIKQALKKTVNNATVNLKRHIESS